MPSITILMAIHVVFVTVVGLGLGYLFRHMFTVSMMTCIISIMSAGFVVTAHFKL